MSCQTCHVPSEFRQTRIEHVFPAIIWHFSTKTMQLCPQDFETHFCAHLSPKPVPLHVSVSQSERDLGLSTISINQLRSHRHSQRPLDQIRTVRAWLRTVCAKVHYLTVLQFPTQASLSFPRTIEYRPWNSSFKYFPFHLVTRDRIDSERGTRKRLHIPAANHAWCRISPGFCPSLLQISFTNWRFRTTPAWGRSDRVAQCAIKWIKLNKQDYNMLCYGVCVVNRGKRVPKLSMSTNTRIRGRREPQNQIDVNYCR